MNRATKNSIIQTIAQNPPEGITARGKLWAPYEWAPGGGIWGDVEWPLLELDQGPEWPSTLHRDTLASVVCPNCREAPNFLADDGPVKASPVAIVTIERHDWTDGRKTYRVWLGQCGKCKAIHWKIDE